MFRVSNESIRRATASIAAYDSSELIRQGSYRMILHRRLIGINLD